VNARTDVFLLGLGPEEKRVGEALARAERYRAAGADGFFVPGIAAPTDIRAITSGVPLPVNVLGRPGLPAAAELQKLGVRRLSAGSGVARTALRQVASAAHEFLRTGSSEVFVGEGPSYDQLNALLTGAH
jgi:2-methylisocitrate lyase-like PEP mutase family enzyme